MEPSLFLSCSNKFVLNQLLSDYNYYLVPISRMEAAIKIFGNKIMELKLRNIDELVTQIKLLNVKVCDVYFLINIGNGTNMVEKGAVEINGLFFNKVDRAPLTETEAGDICEALGQNFYNEEKCIIYKNINTKKPGKFYINFETSLSEFNFTKDGKLNLKSFPIYFNEDLRLTAAFDSLDFGAIFFDN
jgi:hypothetical protein